MLAYWPDRSEKPRPNVRHHHKAESSPIQPKLARERSEWWNLWGFVLAQPFYTQPRSLSWLSGLSDQQPSIIARIEILRWPPQLIRQRKGHPCSFITMDFSPRLAWHHQLSKPLKIWAVPCRRSTVMSRLLWRSRTKMQMRSKNSWNLLLIRQPWH